ncbi:hypothetical protein [Nostoc sp.]|uniref:hypothetical protein n=1 Tax=Nostoc sp. TaxID=1180 RepID=UPI002FFADB5F
MDFRKFYIPTVMAGLALLTSANQALAIGIGQYSGYQNNIQGKVDNATLSIQNTYNCSEGTCFKGTITFPNAGFSDLVVGYLSGNKFTMRRYVGNGFNYVQTFNGLTTATSVNGSWFTDSEPNNKGSFSLNQ